MNRRNFLYSSAAFAAPFAASRKSASAEPAKDVKLGIEYVDVKEFHLPQNDSAAMLAHGRARFDKAGLKVIAGGDVFDCAAAFIGSTVRFRAELISTEKNRVNFNVQAQMGETIAGEGMHQPAALDVKSLRERVEDARQ